MNKLQRAEQFRIYARDEKGEYKAVEEGTVIGSRKIIRFKKSIVTDELIIVITQSRSNPVLKDIKVYSSF